MIKTEACPADQPDALMRNVLEEVAEEVFLLDGASLCVTWANRTAIRRSGYDLKELCGLNLADLLPPSQEMDHLFRSLRQGEREEILHYGKRRRRDGSRYSATFRLRCFDNALALFVSDDSEAVTLEQALGRSARRFGDFERELLRVNRAMTALTRVSEALVRAKDEASLLDEVCRLAHDIAGYPLVWVGYARHTPGQPVEAMAVAGRDESYIHEADITWSENDPRGRGPAGRAIRSGRMQIARNIATETSFAPWRQAALRHGFRSTIALPLIVQGLPIGAMILYATDIDAFDDKEVRLLGDLAQNLSYGIHTCRVEAERARAERRLKESEARYRSLVELLPDAVLVHRHGNILFANAKAEQLLHLPPCDRLVGRHLASFLHPRHHPQILPLIERGAYAQVPREMSFVRHGGQEFPVEVVGTEIHFHGECARLIVARDITERRQVQAQLVQTAKLATLGEMAAGMAHELSQPINVIRMAAEATLMFMDRGKANHDFQRTQFSMIEAQAGRMAEIIDHIRIFSRKDTAPVEVFDAILVLQSAVQLMAHQAESHDIAVQLAFPSAPWPVSGRPVQLEQVILNLLANAVDAIRQRREEQPGHRGFISLKAAAGADGMLRVEVCDNGIGIPPDVLDRLFEPFFTTKPVGHGTGLGLSVSFGIATSMGGRLEALPGRSGSCFVLTLPRAADCGLLAADCATQPLPSAGTEATHVLLVDDEPLAVETMAHFLGELGYRISIAHNGREAWEVYRNDPADVVVTDLRMPDMDGEMLIDHLRDIDPLQPIVVVTGHMGATEQLGRHGEDDRLTLLKKPVSLAALAQEVERLSRPPA